MSVTIGGVVCQELVDGLVEGVREGGPYAQKRYLCDWDSRYQLANAFLGLVSASGKQVTITSPLGYPQSPNMLAREIAIEGVGKPTQGPVQLQFPKAKVTVSYGVPQWSAIPYPQNSFDPNNAYVYATQEVHFSREMVSIENSALTLYPSGHNLNSTTNYSFPLPNARLTIQLQRVPYLPWDVIWDCLKNPLNLNTFLGVEPGYLLFEGADSHQEASTDGTYVQNLTLNFAARQILRWDEVFDPDGTTGPQQVLYNGLGILGESDLSVLIPNAYQ